MLKWLGIWLKYKAILGPLVDAVEAFMAGKPVNVPLVYGGRKFVISIQEVK